MILYLQKSDSLYRHISYIQRSDFLIDGTIFENVALKRYEKVPDEALFEH